MTRQDECRRFLAGAGWQDATREPLAGDASARRYERLTHPDRGRAVLMDAPPATGEDTRPFRRIAEHLAGLGLSPPRVFAGDAEGGFLLLEDLGDAVFARLVDSDPTREEPLYLAATEALLVLQAGPMPAGLPSPGPDALAQATDLVLTFYAAGAGLSAGPGALADLQQLVRDALQRLPATAPVLALRDFHAENLIWLPDRKGPARVGLLDFQDAFAGHPAYDLVSLLEDARRDVSEPTRAAALAHFAELGGHDPGDLARACAILGAQRNLRILGVFARLAMSRGKVQYTNLIPRVWNHLARDLSHPELADLAAFVRETLPEPTEARLARIREARGTCPTP